MGMFSVVKREVRHVGGIALYLLLSFGIFATLKKLILASYQIEFSALLPTVIGAFALAVSSIQQRLRGANGNALIF